MGDAMSFICSVTFHLGSFTCVTCSPVLLTSLVVAGVVVDLMAFDCILHWCFIFRILWLVEVKC